MQRTVAVLRFKGVEISEDEENALNIAILLHDIGHGPFSHAMEHSIVEGISHEDISLLFMDSLNETFEGKLSLAIQIFRGQYHRKFMLQLISSQLDMDRMDYLKRDSFYSGVAEGNINSERLIQMFNVEGDQLVIEEKGIYSVEKFIVARRLMYWQAYLHKTSVAAELILTKILKRAKELTHEGITLEASAPLQFFLQHKIDNENFSGDVLTKFSRLDDFDIISAIKAWQFADDHVLCELSKMIINRDLPKIKLQAEKASREEVNALRDKAMSKLGITEKEAKYFVFEGKIKNQAYNKEGEPIHIMLKDRSLIDVVQASDQLNLKALSKPVTKYYVCFPKVLLEEASI
jgi:HD superfamily phosphohydrolase